MSGSTAPDAAVAAALEQLAAALAAVRLGGGPPAAVGQPTFVVNNYHLNIHLGGPLGAPEPAAEPAAEEAAPAEEPADAAAAAQTPCGPGAAPGKEPAAAPDAATEHCPADDAEDAAGRRNGEAWAYAVWHHPLRPALRGVHSGGGAAWAALRPMLPDGRYSYASGTRLRRFDSEGEALVAYHAEAAEHNAPQSPNVWRHPLQEPL